jgi:hypothetical protein
LAEVLLLHRLIMDQSGQQSLVRDLGAVESAVAQPRQTFGGADLYPEASGALDRAGLQAWIEAHQR